jgi:DNA polymerase (family X)
MLMKKEMTNINIAELLRAVAASYKLKGEEENKFKIVAYERAADAVEHASSELKDLWDEGKLEEIAGIGKSIAGHLDDLFKTGVSGHFEKVMKGLPRQMFELMAVPGIGVKTAFKLTESLNIGEKTPLEDLKKAAKNGEIEKIEGFGKESQEDIIKSINEVRRRKKRMLLPYATDVAGTINEWLKKCPFVIKNDSLGSLRRRVSTVGDIDIAVAAENSKEVIEHFIKYPKAQRVVEKGDKTASIILPSGVRVDLMVQPVKSYGSLLQHFTGSKHHNIALREFALKKNLSISEYGVKKDKEKDMVTFESEESFYKYLGLEWIPPELREDNGEIEASLRQAQGKFPGLPQLVRYSDVKADLQVHSDFDIETSHDLGLSTMEDIVDKANILNYEYLALTEHNPSSNKHTSNRIIELLKRKKDKIEQLNNSYVKSVKGSVIKVFNSLEIDILANGKLPISDSGMELLDFALISIHSGFRMSKQKMTDRVIGAFSHPKIKIFAHPTGRKLGYREGVELDWDRIFDFCINNNKILEINASPTRLDLPDFLVKEAVKHGIKLSLGTDAHHIDHMDNMDYGVSVARRGWAEKKDIINTVSLEEFEKMII